MGGKVFLREARAPLLRKRGGDSIFGVPKGWDLPETRAELNMSKATICHAEQSKHPYQRSVLAEGMLRLRHEIAMRPHGSAQPDKG